MQSEDNVCNQQSGRTVQKDTPIPNPLSEMPLVSVLIPTHNRPEYVELALQSVLSQTYSNLEIIVSDNSDNDLTEKRLADYVRRHTHIRYIRLPSCGPLENFQTCYESAKGEYINYLMDDDLFHPEKIQIMMSYMLVKPNIGLVTSFRQLIDADGVGMPPIPGTERVFNSETLIDGRSLGAMILSNGQNIIGEPTTVLFRRRDAGEKFGCFLGRQYTTLLDVATWLGVLESKDCVYLPTSLSFVRNKDPQPSSNRVDQSFEWLSILSDAVKLNAFRFGRDAADDLLARKLTSSLWLLMSLRKEERDDAIGLTDILLIIKDVIKLLFGKNEHAHGAVEMTYKHSIGGGMDQHASGAILRDFFENHQHRLIHKWMHYFEIYERHFSRFRGQSASLLEFGVLHGGSLQMWKHYFGPGAQIYGVDINPRCAELAEENITILLADQESRESLRHLCGTLPQFDIIIDDGGHTMVQQMTTFEEMWGQLKDGGIYLCEDMHTSYWPAFGGAYKSPTNFMEYTKNLIDQLNAWYSVEGSGLVVDGFTRSAFAMHYYDSVLVIEKRAMKAPHARMKGTPSFPLAPAERAVYDRG